MKLGDIQEIEVRAKHQAYVAKLYARVNKMEQIDLGERYGEPLTVDLTPELRSVVLASIAGKWAAETKRLRELGVEFDESVTVESMAAAVG